MRAFGVWLVIVKIWGEAVQVVLHFHETNRIMQTQQVNLCRNLQRILDENRSALSAQDIAFLKEILARLNQLEKQTDKKRKLEIVNCVDLLARYLIPLSNIDLTSWF